MRKKDTLMHIILVPRPDYLRPVRVRSPLDAALSFGTAGIVTALLFGVIMSVVPTGSLFARETAPVTHAAPHYAPHYAAPSADHVGATVVLPTVQVIAAN